MFKSLIISTRLKTFISFHFLIKTCSILVVVTFCLINTYKHGLYGLQWFLIALANSIHSIFSHRIRQNGCAFNENGCAFYCWQCLFDCLSYNNPSFQFPQLIVSWLRIICISITNSDQYRLALLFNCFSRSVLKRIRSISTIIS